jgi:hypothetical protein
MALSIAGILWTVIFSVLALMCFVLAFWEMNSGYPVGAPNPRIIISQISLGIIFLTITFVPLMLNSNTTLFNQPRSKEEIKK